MKPLRHRILVCLDRSPSSDGCVAYALWLAKLFDSDVTLAHVMQPPGSRSRGPHAIDTLGWEVSRQEAESYFGLLERKVGAALGRPVDIRVEQGRPAERIVDIAREIRADITVLANPRESGGGWRLGDTVQHVLAASRSSVLLAHTASGMAAAPAPTRFLVPLDGSGRAESVLPAVARMARERGCEVLLVHVVPEPVKTTLLASTEDFALAERLADLQEQRAKPYLERLREQLARDVPLVSTLVTRSTNAPQVLVRSSLDQQSDIIVLSAHGTTCDTSRSFGGMTGFFLTYAKVSLLVLQDLPEGDDRREGNGELRPAPTLRPLAHSGSV